jgi:capsular polysaccharide biosynthesis protein
MDDSGNGHWRSAAPAPGLFEASNSGWWSQLSEPGAALDISQPIAMLKHRRRLIFAWAFVFALAAGLMTKFVLTKWYRAFAVISPTPQEDLSQSAGMYDVGMQMMLGDLMGSGAVALAQKYTLIVKSYEFTMDLVDRYALAPRVWGSKQKLEEAATQNPQTLRWRTYKLMLGRFNSEYDYKSGSLSLSFIDPEPAQAKRIVGLYVDSLRSKLREEAVHKASVIAASLQAQAVKTSDPLLQSRLYQLAAQQLQRQIIAQAQSDFFFSLVDPPVAPGVIYSPSAKLNALLGAIVGAILCSVLVLAYDSRRARRAKRREAGVPTTQRQDEPSSRPAGAALGAR